MGWKQVLVAIFFSIWGKKSHLLPCGSISSISWRSLVLVPRLFWSSAVVNLHFSCPNSASWVCAVLDIFQPEIVCSLNFLDSPVVRLQTVRSAVTCPAHRLYSLSLLTSCVRVAVIVQVKNIQPTNLVKRRRFSLDWNYLPFNPCTFAHDMWWLCGYMLHSLVRRITM